MRGLSSVGNKQELQDRLQLALQDGTGIFFCCTSCKAAHGMTSLSELLSFFFSLINRSCMSL